MAVVTYLLRADLRRRWRSLALLVLLVAIVVAAVLTATAGARRTRTTFDRYLEQVRPLDAIASFDNEPTDVATLAKTVEEVDGVEAAIGFRWYAVFPAGGPDGFYFLPLFVPSDPRVPDTYQRAPLVAGRAPDPSAPLEIALSERTARRLGVGVGDAVPALSYTPEAAATMISTGEFGPPDGLELSFEVMGIVRTPGDLVSRESDVEALFLTPAFASTYGDQIGLFNAGLMLAVEPDASADTAAQDLAQIGGFTLETSFGPDVLRNQADPTLAAMATGLGVVAIIVLLVGAVVLTQTLARAATDRLGDHEGIRALGAPRPVLLLQLCLPSALAAGLGVILGGALSVALSPVVLWGLARRAEPDPGVRIDLPVLVLGMLGAAALLTLTLALVTGLVLRRDRQTGGVPRTSAAAASAAGLGAPVPVVSGLRLALERGRGSRTTPVAGAAVAAAISGIGVMATVVFASSLHHAVTTPAVFGWANDGVMVGNENGDDLSDGDQARLVSDLTADPAFGAVAEIVNDVEITVNGAPKRAWVQQDLAGHSPFVMVRGREPVGPAELAVGAKTLDELGLDLGDTVEVSAGGLPRRLEIVGVVALPTTDDGGSSTLGVAMRGEAADALGFSGSCVDAECSRYLAVTTVPGVDATEAVQPYLSDAVAFVTPAPPAEVERLRAIDGLPRVLALILVFIAVLALTHAAAVTVRRRRADLAMLRVLGFSGRQLRRAVTVQVTVLALGGAVIGVVLGVALGRLLWTAVADSVPLPAVITFPATALVVVPLAIAGLAQLGASLSRRSAGRVRPALALRAE